MSSITPLEIRIIIKHYTTSFIKTFKILKVVCLMTGPGTWESIPHSSTDTLYYFVQFTILCLSFTICKMGLVLSIPLIRYYKA